MSYYYALVANVTAVLSCWSSCLFKFSGWMCKYMENITKCTPFVWLLPWGNVLLSRMGHYSHYFNIYAIESWMLYYIFHGLIGILFLFYWEKLSMIKFQIEYIKRTAVNLYLFWEETVLLWNNQQIHVYSVENYWTSFYH